MNEHCEHPWMSGKTLKANRKGHLITKNNASNRLPRDYEIAWYPHGCLFVVGRLVFDLARSLLLASVV